ncbi:MAG TPA: peptidoglycan-associated lipoprotein Pal [Bryobacteraceae bacterium]|nr:peptidoglycan-associated lipoprotein Pal [Bryobacteraceae bacterium]
MSLHKSWFGMMAVLAVLVLFTASCGKKVPPPPPPPPPPPTQEAPPPRAAAPVINSFTAEPSTIEAGQSSTLRWSTTGATDMNIDHGVGAVQSSGSRQVFPRSTTSYTLTVRGPGGMDSRSVTVELANAPPPPPPTRTPQVDGGTLLSQQGQDAFFDYDMSELRADGRDALTKDAALLKQIFQQDPNFTVIVEGHCDERGSAEYNLALGDRRATAAKDFLVQQGVPADKLKTISYGKERPQCTEENEQCWQRNRRAHLAAGQ